MRPSVWRLPGMPSLVVMSFTGFSGYAVLLPTAPLWALHGGAGTGGSGLVNGVLLLFTVLTQLFVPPALRRFGWGPVLTAGMVLLGLPGAAYALSDSLGPVLALSAVRGVGFGVLTVTGSAAVAALVGTERRGEAIGVYGLAVAFPNLVLLPAGPWVAGHVGFWAVFLVSALPLAGIPAGLRLSRQLPGEVPELVHVPGDHGDGSGPRTPRDAGSRVPYSRLVRPTLLLTSVTMVGGAAITFVPQLTDDDLLAATALLLMGLVSALSRWRAGLLADRHGVRRFLAPLVVVSAVGTAMVAGSVAGSVPARAGLLLGGMVVLGVSYGALQNLTLVAAFGAVPQRDHQVASAVWNVGFDAGTALGSVAVGLIAQRASFGSAFLVMTVLTAAVLPVAGLRRGTGMRSEGR